MTLPLYNSVAKNPPKLGNSGHAGLWFDKFCNTWLVKDTTWSMSIQGSDKDGPKLKWINTLAGKSVGVHDQIKECASRVVRLVETRDGICAVFTTESRFVTGLGRSHPVENGFAWHPTLGTPYLPGSSVKGMVRAWAEQETDPRPGSEELDRLLGKHNSAGNICFLDALPIKPVKLEADVMTPHYAGLVREGRSAGRLALTNPHSLLGHRRRDIVPLRHHPSSLRFASRPITGRILDPRRLGMGWCRRQNRDRVRPSGPRRGEGPRSQGATRRS